MTVDIFELAKNEVQKKERKRLEDAQQGEDVALDVERSVILLGSGGSGKSSLVLRFLDREEAPKKTVALEYTYGRRSKGQAKEVAHIWELGGGLAHTDLLDIVINDETLASPLAIILCLDLSKPETLWVTLEDMLAKMTKVVDVALSKWDEDTKNELLLKAAERFPADHDDKELLKPFPIPLSILGCMYDVFQDFEPERKKMIVKMLRFMAHTTGSNLQFYSTKIETLVTRARALLSHILFNTQHSKVVSTDHNKPVFLYCGGDSIKDIGLPPVSTEELQALQAGTPLDMWKNSFLSMFPQNDTSDVGDAEDPCKDPQYKEDKIDTARAQKDEVLGQYIKEQERKEKINQAAPVET